MQRDKTTSRHAKRQKDAMHKYKKKKKQKKKKKKKTRNYSIRKDETRPAKD